MKIELFELSCKTISLVLKLKGIDYFFDVLYYEIKDDAIALKAWKYVLCLYHIKDKTYLYTINIKEALDIIDTFEDSTYYVKKAKELYEILEDDR